MSYENLLDRAMKKMPKDIVKTDRFVIPKVEGMISGARTIITNFFEVATALRRKPEHFQKFLLKELATKGNVEGKRLIVLGNFSRDLLNKKLEIYVKNYVVCPQCNKPDTKIEVHDRMMFLVCEACGSKHAVSKI